MSKKYRQLLSREKRQLRAQYGELYDQVNELLYRFDPVGLRLYGVPADEYEGEAELILPRLRTCRSADEVEVVVRDVFTHMFTDGIIGPHVQFHGLAAALWNLPR